MKKIIIGLCLFLSMGFTVHFTELENKLVDYVSDFLKKVKASGTILNEEQMYTSEDEAIPGQDKRYLCYMEKGFLYVYQVVSDGALIQACYAENIDESPRRNRKDIKCTNIVGDKTTITIIPRNSGQHILIVKTLGNKSGNHVGHLNLYYQKGQVLPPRQDEFKWSN